MLVGEVLRNLQILNNKKYKQVELAIVFDDEEKEDDKDKDKVSTKARAFINNRLKRNQDFSENELEKIAQYYKVSVEDLKNPDPIVELDLIHYHPSCGKGTEIVAAPYVEPFRISKNSIASYLKCSSYKNLKIFPAEGDSMEDTIHDGDFLLVDVGRRDVSVSGVYVFILNKQDIRCKRLNLTVKNYLEVISDNKAKYDKEIIKPSDNIEVEIIGRVLVNLNKGL